MHSDAIRQVLRRQPFEPFLLRMNDGSVFHVPHPDYVAVSHRVIVFIDPVTDAMIYLEPVLIASLEPLTAQQPRTGDTSGGNT